MYKKVNNRWTTPGALRQKRAFNSMEDEDDDDDDGGEARYASLLKLKVIIFVTSESAESQVPMQY